MTSSVRNEAFDPWVELQAYQDALNLGGRFGATAVFVGTMQDFGQGHL